MRRFKCDKLLLATVSILLVLDGAILEASSNKEERINVGITFTKVAQNKNLQEKFKVCVTSLLKHATVDINFYIIGDHDSQMIARRIFDQAANVNIKFEVISDFFLLFLESHQVVI